MSPIDVVAAGDGSGRMFIVEQIGLVLVMDADGVHSDVPFLDIRDRVVAGGEQGLLGLAFHPGYACNGRLFVNYTDHSGDTNIAEFHVSATDPDRADPSTGSVLLHIPQPFENHNGGDLVFGPDGYLYIGMGDGGSANDPQGNGQKLDTLLGKLLRVDVDHRSSGAAYAIPPGNCAGCPAGALPEIQAYGLRNPWRFTFDRATGDLWIGDVGQDRYEEVDHVTLAAASGANFGWSRTEGSHCLNGDTCDRSGLTGPVVEYPHARGDCSVIGGAVYRGSAIPALAGWYFFGDYCSGRMRALSTAAGAAPGIVLETGGPIASFGEDEAGELYVTNPDAGTVSQIVAGP